MTNQAERIPLEARLKQIDGLTFLRAIRDGEAPPPPIATLMNFVHRGDRRGPRSVRRHTGRARL